MIKDSMFFELLKVALEHRKMLSHEPSAEEWGYMFVVAQRQAIAGVLFGALEELSNNGQKPPTDILFEWIGLSEQIKAANKKMNRQCVELTKRFHDIGWRSCILKGQGNAMRYPNPLLRTTAT